VPPPWTIVAFLRASARYSEILSNAFLSITAPMKFRKSATSPILMSRIIATVRSRTSAHRERGT
jgi:hypothetical protein